MPIPTGFKVNGSKIPRDILVPPRVKKIMALLDKLPFSELLTSMEVSARSGLSCGGSWTNHPALVDYREKIDNKFFWGSRKSIAQLRTQLAASEEIQNENQ